MRLTSLYLKLYADSHILSIQKDKLLYLTHALLVVQISVIGHYANPNVALIKITYKGQQI
jgi:hypothetical protein